jgi:hypothetical protein
LAARFQVIDFGDTLEVSASSSPLHDTLTCDAPGVPLDSTNLVLKAFDLFRRKTGSKQARRGSCGSVCVPLRLGVGLLRRERAREDLRARAHARSHTDKGLCADRALLCFTPAPACSRPRSTTGAIW